jgi:hypothetical protein
MEYLVLSRRLIRTILVNNIIAMMVCHIIAIIRIPVGWWRCEVNIDG